jgi:ubiquinone/menaquinone biosynthesis C-methylase UbiE
MTRWQQFYLEDERIQSTPPSACAQRAVELFSRYSKRVILDLGCGVGRDTFHLAAAGLSVVGADAAASGLVIAQRLRTRGQGDVVWMRADARALSFADGAFEGVYCFGLLHEFTGEGWEEDVRDTMHEVHRVLAVQGVLVIAVLSGDPEVGLPHVHMFTEEMFDRATQPFHTVEKTEYEDIGCTGRRNYRVWRGVFVK